ncbi:hypothetical protein KUTeg_006011 [Tegillarca granosa]|uniref:Peroxidase n=1 Tax=Tegillarca granosa TaxID=220873 RepID=A0ABQ9FF77_TEGGR|nr:hypothetical protein KUTeg_006011 [Tegillarca granosa]
MRGVFIILCSITILHYTDSALSVPNVKLSLNEILETGLQSENKRIGLPKSGVASKPGLEPAIVPSKAVLDQSLQAAKTASLKLDNIDQQQQRSGIDKSDTQAEMFGPHLFTNDKALEIGQIGDVFLQTASNTVKKLGISPSAARDSLRRITLPVIDRIRCPFQIIPRCNTNYPYRQPDGSCNNLKHPLWGKAFTPFERFIPGFYDDGIQSPRETSAVSGQKLPGTRRISVTVHSASTSLHEMDDVSHFTMEFGQFVSHDIQRNALSRGYLGSNMDCCRTPTRRNCFPISIDANDPHFGRFGRRCMNMVRALPTPNLECTFGKLKSADNGNLLPKDNSDVRVNQQPMLMSLHTIWMKEHNRIATELAKINPHWNDEKLFQEARKIVIAELQHITYNEYLEEILGNQYLQAFDLKPRASGYFTKYNANTKPQIRNSFAAAAFRFGHSMIRDKVAYRKTGQTTRQEYLFRTFLRPELIYSPLGGVDGVTRGLYEAAAQSVDRLFTTQITNHLFERRPGFGGDLAAINIQRGRDHGMANYNTWRVVCGLKPAETFQAQTHRGLLDHTADAAKALSKAYAHPDDIDFYTGGVSEIPISGGKVGPLFACIIGLQFKALKYGDRFFYESNNANVKFTPQQLAEIRKTTMARVICDNTNIDQLPTDVFRKTKFPSNLIKDAIHLENLTSNIGKTV